MGGEVNRSLLRDDTFVYERQTRLIRHGEADEVMTDAINQTRDEIEQELKDGFPIPSVDEWVKRIEQRFHSLMLETAHETNDKLKGHRRFLILARDKFRCFYCGKTSFEADRELTVDHIIPRKYGGMDTAANLVACCRSCNSQKGAQRLPNERELLREIANRNKEAGIAPGSVIRFVV